MSTPICVRDKLQWISHCAAHNGDADRVRSICLACAHGIREDRFEHERVENLVWLFGRSGRVVYVSRELSRSL